MARKKIPDTMAATRRLPQFRRAKVQVEDAKAAITTQLKNTGALINGMAICADVMRRTEIAADVRFRPPKGGKMPMGGEATVTFGSYGRSGCRWNNGETTGRTFAVSDDDQG
jgi:hypothetical protein